MPQSVGNYTGTLNVFLNISHKLSAENSFLFFAFSIGDFKNIELNYFVTVNCFTQSHGLEMSKKGVKM